MTTVPVFHQTIDTQEPHWVLSIRYYPVQLDYGVEFEVIWNDPADINLERICIYKLAIQILKAHVTCTQKGLSLS